MFRRGGASEVPALGAVAAHRAQPGGLDGGLDALGGHGQPEPVRETDERGHDRVVEVVVAQAVLRSQALAERAGQLQRVDRQLAGRSCAAPSGS